MKKLLLIILGFAVVAVTYLNIGGYPQPINPNLVSAKMLQPGPYPVSWEDVSLVDNSRSTSPSGDYPGANSRTLLTRIWYAQDVSEPQPLVFYSHGFMSTRIGGKFLAEHLASHGYVVAAVDFPSTNFESSGPQLAIDVVNQPGDASFIISNLLQRNTKPNDVLYKHIDPNRIAAVGMSLGGMTTTLLGYHHNWRDPRISVAVSVAGPSAMFSKRFFQNNSIPFLMLATPTDAMVSFDENAGDILNRVSNATLASFALASHAGFSFQSRSLRHFDNPDQIGCWMLAGAIDQKEDWYDKLGTPEQGIVDMGDPRLCELDPLPKVMNPIYQQQY